MTIMLEHELRETFAAKAGSPPPGSLASLTGAADTAIRGAARVRRRRRAVVTGLSGFVAVAVASVAVTQTLTGGAPGDLLPQAQGPASQPQTEQHPSSWASRSMPAAPSGMREVDAVKPSAQAATRVRLQLPARSTVTAAYQAKDGYLVVNTQPDGDKQLVLQDDKNQQKVLVEDASNITVAKDGKMLAWASQGQMNVGSRSGDDSNKVTAKYSVDVPADTKPVTFVGTNLVISNDGEGFGVWPTEGKYNQKWDTTVVRVFGGTTDNKGVYAEVLAKASDTPMCLALLEFDQPFKKTKNTICGLPAAAKEGGARISPDGRWLAYPVKGLKQVAILDLTTVFTDGKPKVWDLSVTSNTVWLNATTFVVDNGKKFLKLNPGAKTSEYDSLDQESDGAVLIEPLADH
ncbi:hypothetical protein ABT297_35735 [Dactylosporangium sp. NPDC000555]|uniref:hypothetical protein n=1 Tax=Dactylosporangium sp. NPDC000555 TaxID=3154260 RepID=UPI00331E0525